MIMKKLLLLLLPLIGYSQMQQTFSGEIIYINGDEYEIIGKSYNQNISFINEITIEDAIDAPSDYDAVYNYDIYRQNNFNIDLNIFEEKTGQAIIRKSNNEYYLINLYED